MRRLALLSILLGAGPPAAWAAPRLIVVISVDQMRADFLDRAPYQGGLKTLKEGAVFTDAHHVHVPTETGPGHSVILTGRFPATTGIVGNDWYDRALGRRMYVVEDSVHGKGPEHLQGYTLGDALKAKDPLSKVVSISLKDRSAILMAGKRPDAVLWLDRKAGGFATSGYYGARPAWLDAYNAMLRTPGAPLDSGTTEQFRNALTSPVGDAMLRDLVKEVLERYELGHDEHTDILAVSFSAPDYVGHEFGPDSPEMGVQLAALDQVLADVLAQAEARAGKAGLDVVLTADHGVLPVPESAQGRQLKARRISEARFLAAVESTLQTLAPVPGRRWLLAANFPHLYLDRSLAGPKKLDWPSFLGQAAKALLGVDGVAQVYVPGAWPAADPYSDVFQRSYFPDRSGDLLVRLAPGVLPSDDYAVGTSHGAPYEYDTHVALVFWGPDFKPGVYKAKAEVADIAPTLGMLLGLDYPAAATATAHAEALVLPTAPAEAKP